MGFEIFSIFNLPEDEKKTTVMVTMPLKTVIIKNSIVYNSPSLEGQIFYSANNSFPRPAVYLAPAAKPFSSVSAIKSFSISSAAK